MNGKEFGKFVNKFQEQQRDLLLKKANDYALDVDVLSNFKLAGASINLKPEISALSNISTKVVRLGNLLNSPTQNKLVLNESVSDTLIDLANYVILLSAILHAENMGNLERTDMVS